MRTAVVEAVTLKRARGRGVKVWYRVVDTETREELRLAHWNLGMASEWANGWNAAMAATRSPSTAEVGEPG